MKPIQHSTDRFVQYAPGRLGAPARARIEFDAAIAKAATSNMRRDYHDAQAADTRLHAIAMIADPAGDRWHLIEHSEMRQIMYASQHGRRDALLMLDTLQQERERGQGTYNPARWAARAEQSTSVDVRIAEELERQMMNQPDPSIQAGDPDFIATQAEAAGMDKATRRDAETQQSQPPVTTVTTLTALRHGDINQYRASVAADLQTGRTTLPKLRAELENYLTDQSIENSQAAPTAADRATMDAKVKTTYAAASAALIEEDEEEM